MDFFSEKLIPYPSSFVSIKEYGVFEKGIMVFGFTWLYVVTSASQSGWFIVFTKLSNSPSFQLIYWSQFVTNNCESVSIYFFANKTDSAAPLVKILLLIIWAFGLMSCIKLCKRSFQSLLSYSLIIKI